MKQIILNLDQPAKQVCIETKFMELNDVASEKIGLRWDSLDQFGVNVGVGPFTRTEETTAGRTKENKLTRWDKRQTTDEINRRYDVDNVPYEESTTTYEESPPDSGNWIANTVITPTRNVVDTVDTGENNESAIVNTFAKTIAERQAAILTLDSFNVVLSALRRMDGVSVISNPKIIVANGATNANFSVGEREPIIRKEIQRGTTDSPGDVITAQLDTGINTDDIRQGYLSTGINLQVIPVVKTDDLIEADIRPSLRRKISDKQVEGNTWPIISVKEIRTRFTLRSGQTVAIGGLTDSQDAKKVSKVPLLGDIPLLGKYLFSHTEDATRQVETIIFVTLSLADPTRLEREDGIPEDAKLVHQKLLQSAAGKRKFQADMDALRQAGEAETSRKAQAAKARLLRMEKVAG
jgi:type II secretory pathway component GspD/PulD (secretin)